MPHVDNDGVSIHYEAVGEGVPVMLHHGLADSLASWDRTGWARRLATRHRVLLIDARGHGESDKPHAPEAYTSERMVGDILAVLDAEGEEAMHFVGYSMGGRMGFELAHAAPERLHSLTVGAAHPYAQSLGSARDAIGRGFGPWLKQFASLEGELGTAILTHFMRNDPDALKACTATDRPDRSDVLARFEKPTLLFVGSEDSAAEAMMHSAFTLPHGHLVLVPGYDHFQLGLRIDVVLAAVDAFLDEASRTEASGR
jgi:pimeloyl-ACP methyl ester carboxylesterase